MYAEVITGNLYDLMMYAKALEDAHTSDSGAGVEIFLMEVDDPKMWRPEHRARYEDYVRTNALGAARVAGSPHVVVKVVEGKITVGDFDTARKAGRNFDQMCVIHDTEGYRLGYRVVKDGPLS